MIYVCKYFKQIDKRIDKYRRIFRPVHKVSTLIQNENEIYMRVKGLLNTKISTVR